MKTYTILLLAFLFAIKIGFSQTTQEKCASHSVFSNHLAQDQSLNAYSSKLNSDFDDWLKNYKVYHKTNDGIYHIPVVVHVVYIDPSENISNAQIQSQIDILNEDFRRQNADTVNMNPIFAGIGADIGIEFHLATTDPQGNPTTGITRTAGQGELPGVLDFYTPFTDKVKFDSSGGKSNWDPTKYLNIWVCNLMPSLLGYAQFPDELTTAPNTDGVVIDFEYFGNIGTALTGKGRTATHEIGHWLGLRHIWGDGDCDSTDYVADTPEAAQSNSGCPSPPPNSCVDLGSIDFPDMIENYMDYTDDDCMNTFTKGQKDRMIFYLTTIRQDIFTTDKSQNLELENKIKVYPNPSSNFVYISVISELEIQSVKVFDLNGKIVMQSQNQLNKLNISELNSGLYILQIKTNKGLAFKKLTKQ